MLCLVYPVDEVKGNRSEFGVCGLSYDEGQRSRSEVCCSQFVLWMREGGVEL